MSVRFPTPDSKDSGWFASGSSNRRSWDAFPVVVAGLLSCVAVGVSAREVQLGAHVFQLPEGFDVEVAAAPPLLRSPISADFDPQGRLYVTDSAGVNDNVQKQLAERPHRVLQLTDVDRDGVFDRRTVFADRMMFPEGILVYRGSVFVAAPPSIWKLTDTNDDGVADSREEWFQGRTLTGCANDLHGPYLGPDGWIYWCKGAFAEQTYERSGQSPFVTRAAHIFRRRPEGGPVESVMTGGMDNPVEVAFLPNGDRFFTTTFIQHPAAGRRDAIVHAVYGGVYGKPHGVLDGHPRTGELMPVMTHLGAAAPSGLTRYASRVFGKEFENNLFATLFNMRKVTRHILEPDGATYRTLDSDFLVSDQLDFHPTDVLEDADGSLLIVDTGGWYKLCCPTSQLPKPDVLGAIYRVRKRQATKLADPRGLQLDWGVSAAELAARLDDPRVVVRRRAVAILSHVQDAAAEGATYRALGTLLEHDDPRVRQRAVWVATAMSGGEARRIVRRALRDADAGVRQAAASSVAVWRDRAAADVLAERILLEGPMGRRTVAEALGRMGDVSVVPVLVDAAALAGDRVTEHALTYALIELGEAEATAAALESSDPAGRRIALTALDQMDGGGVSRDVAFALLKSRDPSERSVAFSVIERREDWGDFLVQHLEGLLGAATGSREPSVSDPSGRLDEWRERIASLAHRDNVQRFVAARVADPRTPDAFRGALLEAMRTARLKKTPAAWVEALSTLLARDDSGVLDAAIATIRALPTTTDTELAAALKRRAREPSLSVVSRLHALEAATSAVSLDDDMFAFALERLAPTEAVAVRSAAARTIAAAQLTTPQQQAIVERLSALGPLVVRALAPIFARVSDDTLAIAAFDAVSGAPGRDGLRRSELEAWLKDASPSVRRRADAFFSDQEDRTTGLDAKEKRAKLEAIASKLSSADVRRGQRVFHSSKAACSSCHALGYLGGRVGPDLTRIGDIRSDLDLLEAIVYPNSSFVRSYEPTTILRVDGTVVSGIVRDEGAAGLRAVTGADTSVFVPREEVRELIPSSVSVMPSGLEAQLSHQELADLVAFLKVAR